MKIELTEDQIEMLKDAASREVDKWEKEADEAPTVPVKNIAIDCRNAWAKIMEIMFQALN